MLIAVIDNFDSFVFNLVQQLGALGATLRVFRNDAIDVEGLRSLGPAALVVSPGPGRPEDAGVTVDAIRELSGSIPTLGVCLGHQAIATAFGGSVTRAREPRHGKASPVEHDGAGIFEGLPPSFDACRYHSLVVREQGLPSALRVTARTDHRVVMGLAHASRPLFGVQFHPESILTPLGPRILGNFLEIARTYRARRD